jgi:hypothetical protein
MLSKKSIIVITLILVLVWVGIILTRTVDFDALFETPEDMVYTFQESLTDFDFETAWSKLSTRMQQDVFLDKSSFIEKMYGQPRLRRDLALAKIQSEDEVEENQFKYFLKNWVLNDYVILLVIKDKGRGWKIDDIKLNVGP